MTAPKKQKGILLLDKTKLDCYVVSMPSVVSFPFQPTAVRNIELIDNNQLLIQLRSFLQTNKIPPSDFILILHENILFEKVFANQKPITQKQPASVASESAKAGTVKQTPVSNPAQPQPGVNKQAPPQPVQNIALMKEPARSTASQASENADEMEKAIQHFIESIPFEEVVVSRTKVPEGTKVVGTNKALLLALREIFVNEGSTIDTILPATAFPKETKISNGLTTETVNMLLTRADSLRSQEFHVDDGKQQAVSPLSSPLAMPQKESEKKRLILLGGVFLILIPVMVILLMRMNAENAKYAKKPLSRVTPAPAQVSVTPPPAASESAVTKDTVAIRISGIAAKSRLAQQVQTNLRAVGFTNVSLQPGTVLTGKTLIIFSPDIPTELKEVITGSVASVSAQFTVQESSPSAETTVTITL